MQTYLCLHRDFFCLSSLSFASLPKLNPLIQACNETANEGSLAFAEKLNQAIANLNQWVELRQGSKGGKGKPRKAEEAMIKIQVCLHLHFKQLLHFLQPMAKHLSY